jgi:hypothetical protein
MKQPSNIKPGDAVFVRAFVKSIIDDVDKGKLYSCVEAPDVRAFAWEMKPDAVYSVDRLLDFVDDVNRNQKKQKGGE